MASFLCYVNSVVDTLHDYVVNILRFRVLEWQRIPLDLRITHMQYSMSTRTWT